MVTRYLGIDPGPTPGFVLIASIAGKPAGRVFFTRVVQCDRNSALGTLRMMLGGADAPAIDQVVAIEKFVIGRGSMKSGMAGQVTRGLVESLHGLAVEMGARVVVRSASEVKPWATDLRLDKAGLLDATKGMRHARDAARHALFAAVKDGALPDPFSTRSNR